jgi:hypothetical protein
LLPIAAAFTTLVFVSMEIMKTLPFLSRRKSAVICASLLAPSLAIASDIVLQKAPPLTVEQAPAYPENLARYYFGADVKAIPQSNSAAQLQLSSNGEDRNTSEAALLCEDPTTGYQLPAGRSIILVSLANIENIQSISFLNDGAQGQMAIATSNANVPSNSPEWHNVANCGLSEGAIAASVGPGEAKYVKLTFDTARAGRIAGFGVYATPVLSDFTMPRPRKVSFENPSASFALINYNFTDVHAKARGLYVSSGDPNGINKMIDDQAATAYQFASGDPAPTAVIDLGRERSVSRISAVYSAQPGTVEFYVLNSLPVGDPAEAVGPNESSVQKISNSGQTVDLPASLRIGGKEFTQLKPVGAVATSRAGRASVNFPETTGRYLMLKWHPAGTQSEAFSVAQVAAFGVAKHGSPAQESTSTETTNRRVTAGDDEVVDGKEFGDGKSILDDKNAPTGAQSNVVPPGEGPPPALPPVPPFTFIPVPPGIGPEVPPTSP